MLRQMTTAALCLMLLGTAACDSVPPTITPGAPTQDVSATESALAEADPLRIELLNSEVAVGFERVAFRAYDQSGSPISTALDVEGTFSRVSELGENERVGQQVASGAAAYFGADMPSGGSWVVYSEFDSSGGWWFDVTAKQGDWLGRGRVELDVVGRSGMPRVGDSPPDAETPKIGPGITLADLTSDPDPIEALYTRSVADAKAEGKAAVVLFASPAHSDDPACAANLSRLKRAQADAGEGVVFVHVESRDLDDPEQLSQTARQWGLTGEPWTFIIGKRGFVGARVEGELSTVELDLLLENVQQQQ